MIAPGLDIDFHILVLVLSTPIVFHRDSAKYFDLDNPDGSRVKARWNAYEDGLFNQQKLQEDEHLGILGPVLRAEAGDTIR